MSELAARVTALEREMAAMDRDAKAHFVELRKFAGEQFGRLDRRLGVVERKVDQIDKRLGVVERKVDQIDRRLGVVEGKVDTLCRRFDGFERKLDAIGALLAPPPGP